MLDSVSHSLIRPRTHGLTKKIEHRYKCCFTMFRRQILAAVLKIRESITIPTVAGQRA